MAGVRTVLVALAALVVCTTFAGAGRASETEGLSPPTLLRMIEQRARTVSIGLREARESRQPRAARCASERLSEVHAQLRMARQQAAAIEGSSAAVARSRYRALEVAYQRSAEIALEARSCQRLGWGVTRK